MKSPITTCAICAVCMAAVALFGAAPFRNINPPAIAAAPCGGKPAPLHVQCLGFIRTDLKQLAATPSPLPSSVVYSALVGRPLPRGAQETPPPVFAAGVVVRRSQNDMGNGNIGNGNRNNGSVANPPPAVAPQAGSLVPQDLWIAYNIRAEANAKGVGHTIAIVDALHDPNAEEDMGTYRQQLKLHECTSNNGSPAGCFRQVDQFGNNLIGPKAAQTPTPDAGWASEISLDLDMASAICQYCNIVLVEANSTGFSDLDDALGTAQCLGASVISNSYGAPSDFGVPDSHYNKPGIVIVAASGDSGYGPELPANYPNVVAVGGTTMLASQQQSQNIEVPTFAETVWDASGGGCSHIAKPAWQTDGDLGCSDRTSNDISAVADFNTPVAVFDSYQTSDYSKNGWISMGGTSASAPIIAAMFALAGEEKYQEGAHGIWMDAGAHTNHIFGGANGTCDESYLCQGASRTDSDHPYNGPAGWGTPNGLGAFSNIVVTPSPTPVPVCPKA